MRLILCLFLVAFATKNTHAQQPVQVFVDFRGKIFSQGQRDSIEQAGNVIRISNPRVSGDTVYNSMYAYDKLLQYLPNERKHINKSLPDFKLKSLNGKWISSSDLKGKIIMINFWSTTCSPCVAEFPELNHLKSDFQEKKIVFIGIAPESRRKVSTLLKKRSFDFLILPDASSLMDQLGIDSYPINFFVNEAGIINDVQEGVPYEKVGNSREKAVNKRYSKILNDLLASGR